MNWKHCYLRKADKEEYDYFASEDIWAGEVPYLDEDILVYKDGYFDVDCMTDIDSGIALYNNDYDDFYWCELEKPEEVTNEH